MEPGPGLMGRPPQDFAYLSTGILVLLCAACQAGLCQHNGRDDYDLYFRQMGTH